MHAFLLAATWGWFADGRFLDKVLDEWAIDAQEFIHTKLPRLILLAIVAFALYRLLNLLTTRMVRIAEDHAAAHSRIAQAKTLAGVIRATGLTIIAALVFMQLLAAIGVNLAPLLASAGVAGVAIGLAAQNIVRDMLNGFLILVEDQFNVGETVKLAGVAGVVETMTLRKTTVRDSDGTLYVIPNSQITVVANQDADYSVATVNVSVDFSANPDNVTDLLKKIAIDVRNSEEFRNVFLADPQVLGVDGLKGSELIFPVVFKTRPQQQYAPMREFRRRVRLALEQNHILPGDPGRVYNLAKEDADHPVSPPSAEPAKPAADPTSLKAHEGNPFTGE